MLHIIGNAAELWKDSPELVGNDRSRDGEIQSGHEEKYSLEAMKKMLRDFFSGRGIMKEDDGK